jgi:tripartite-type tricarboxylate transporter receptor subunit TctC
MKFPRRRFLRLAAGATALAAAPRIGDGSQAYPTRPVRVIVPFGTAGATDIVARLMGQWLSERLGQQFVIENRPGAGGMLGTEAAVRAPADGYTLVLVGVFNLINAALYDKLSFDFIRDILPVAAIIRLAHVMEVNLSVPAKTLPEFIAYAKANPGKMNMASVGYGSTTHVAGELFKLMAGVTMTHVPYRSAGAALTDLISGEMQVYFGTTASSIEYIKAGKLRALGVTTALRSRGLPDIPTIAEFVPGYEATNWYGVGVARNTPVGIVEKLNIEINAALADANLHGRLADLGGTVMKGSPGDFGKLIAEEAVKWGKVVEFAGIKAQ